MIRVPPGVRYVSFDLFDTLIARSYAKPADLFFDVPAEATAANLDPVEFQLWRTDAEFKAREVKQFSREVDLDEIYDTLIAAHPFLSSERDQLLQAELRLEARACLAIGESLTFLEHCRSAGHSIVFVTDIYLPEDFIRELLSNLGIYREGDALFVSSTHGVMKHSGQLFQVVLETLGVPAEAMLHVGDNPRSDVEMAAKHGLRSQLHAPVTSNRYETHDDDSLFASKLTGCTRAARLAPWQSVVPASTGADRHATIWQTGCNVVGPILFFWVYWTIAKAIEDGCRHLYFLSRDGQILHRIAQQIVERHFPGEIAISYLYVSRQSLLYPALAAVDEEAIQWIVAPTSQLSVEIIFKRVCLDVEVFRDELREAGISDLSAHLEEPHRKVIRQLLRRNEAMIVEGARQQRQQLLNYFAQEGLLEGGRVGVVDVGWNGTLQRSMARILDLWTDSDTSVTGYYFGVRSERKYHDDDVMRAWFSHFSSPRALDRDEYIIPMTEIFTAADHGGVVSHQERDGHYGPVLRSEENSGALAWGLRVQHEAVAYVASRLLNVLRRDEIIGSAERARELVEERYRLFFTTPTAAEAETFGSFEFAEDQNESYFLTLAAPHGLIDTIRHRGRPPKRHHDEWHYGATMRSGSLTRLLLRT